MPSPYTPLEILMQAFPGLPRNEAEELVASGEVRSYPENVTLCHEDTLEFTFYILLSGEVLVTKRIDHEQVRVLKTLTPGDSFGEMAIIQNMPRAASVITLQPTTVLEIHKDAFNRLLQHSASLSLAMARQVSRRLRENDALAIEDLRLKAGELAEAYQMLAEQDYARREFLTTVAHELRTPLTAANGFMQMIQSNQMQGEMLQAALHNVSRNLQQIVSLVNDILFLQEMDLILPRFQPVDLEQVVNNALSPLKDEAEKNQVLFILKIPASLPKISGDAKSLERAFKAIFDNAIKFSPEGGAVIVSAGSELNKVYLSVEDQGVGIPSQFLPHIFDRYFHLEQVGDRLFRGIGLGLSIARQVIEQHDGQIRVESQEGVGTKVTIFLKMSPA